VEAEIKVVELEEVTKVYELSRWSAKALDNVSVSIEAGEFISVMGPSGSGKTSLLNIIGCLDTPTSGRVAIGSDVLILKGALFAPSSILYVFVGKAFGIGTSMTSGLLQSGKIKTYDALEHLRRRFSESIVCFYY